MPRASATMQAFARAEAQLCEDIAEAEAAAARAQEKRAAAVGRLEELLRVRGIVVGQPAADTPAPLKAEKAAEPKAKPSAAATPQAVGGLPAVGTPSRAVLEAILGGARRYQEIREQTGLAPNTVSVLLPGLVKRGLVVRAGTDDYAPADAAK